MTHPAANPGSRGGGPGGVLGGAGPPPYPTGSGPLLPKTSALIVLGMSEVEKGSEGASERLEDRGPLRRIGVAGELPLPPKAPNPSCSQTFPWSSSPRPANPGSRGWRTRGEGAPSQAASGREAWPRAGGGPAWGWLFPTRLFFFFQWVWGWAAFWEHLKKRRNTQETGLPPPKSRHGTPSPRGPARLAPELGSSPRAGSPGPQAPPPGPTPHPGRLNSGEGMLIWVGPALDGGAEGGRGAQAGVPGAQRRGGRPPLARPRSPRRSRRGLTQCRAARRAEPAPRPAYWASARRDRGLQQITN